MAHQHVGTADAEGEIGDVSQKKPTLKEFISRELGQDTDDIYQKLTSEIGITHIDLLIFSDPSEINEICQKLKLKFVEKMKFKTAIKKLQQIAASKPSQNVNISKEDQAMIDKMDLALKQSQGIKQHFDQQRGSIDNIVEVQTANIDSQIENAMKLLQNRKNELYKQV